MEIVISNDGTTIAYERTGEGPPLVLVHGTGRDHGYWGRTAQLLAPEMAVYALDRRGRNSSGDADAYSLECEVEDVLSVITALGESVHLLGHSYGGIVALEAASRTGSLASLILYEPPINVGTDDGVPDDLGDRLAALMATGDREAVLNTFLREGPRYPPDVIAAHRERSDWATRLSYAHTLPRETQAVNRYRLHAERFSELHVPTLLLLGGESPPLFSAAIHALDAVLPASEVVVLEGQRHAAMETAPEMFAGIVQRFVAKLALGPAV